MSLDQFELAAQIQSKQLPAIVTNETMYNGPGTAVDFRPENHTGNLHESHD